MERLIYLLIFGGLTGLCLWGWWSVIREKLFPTEEDVRRLAERRSSRPTSPASSLVGFGAGIFVTTLAIMCFLSALGVETLIKPF